MIYNDDRSKIKENDIEYFKSKNFDEEDLKELFFYSVKNACFSMIQYFVGNFKAIDFLDDKQTSCLLPLTRNEKGMDILQYLEKNGLDLLKIGNGTLIDQAAINNNIKLVEYLLKDAPMDLVGTEVALHFVAKGNYTFVEENSTKEQSLVEVLPIINILLSKLTNQSFESALYNIGDDKLIQFLKNQYLKVQLDINLSDEKTDKKKYKL